MMFYSYAPMFQQLFERSVDPETGEIINPTFDEELKALQMAQDEKVEQAALAYKNARIEYDALDKTIKELEAKKKKRNDLMEFLKGYVTRELNGKKYKSPLLSIYYGSRSSVDVTDEGKLPEAYWKVTREPMKKKILDAINMGEKVPGAVIRPAPYTVIR